MDPTERNPGAGAAVGALSAAKNKKLIAAIGAALMAIGIAGLIFVGSQAIDTITSGGFSTPQEGSSIQLTQYIFLFTMLAGLIVLIYSVVSIQRNRAKIRLS
jgi:NO-binding membrane sensor protein with MHYT domain